MTLRTSPVTLSAALTVGATFSSLGIALRAAQAAPPAEPFKIANIHFETNASACDMGIQISFDTDGVSAASVKDPNGQVVYQFGSAGGMGDRRRRPKASRNGGAADHRTAVALGCERDDEEDRRSGSTQLFRVARRQVQVQGLAQGTRTSEQAPLSHKVPAGPEILAPADGTIGPRREASHRLEEGDRGDPAGARTGRYRRLPRRRRRGRWRSVAAARRRCSGQLQPA